MDGIVIRSIVDPIQALGFGQGGDVIVRTASVPGDGFRARLNSERPGFQLKTSEAAKIYSPLEPGFFVPPRRRLLNFLETRIFIPSPRRLRNARIHARFASLAPHSK